ncbi:MAG TPA: TolC family protein [Gemmatimonadaceae bacterium]|nr:TolC family protein [Gemmatimonadaceae bacterium]
MRLRIALAAACVIPAASIHAQATPYSRASAVETALDRGARLGVARADTAVATAALIGARALPNPTLSAAYSKARPRYHFTVDVPIDFPMLRQLRIRAAQVGVQAAQLRYQFARASIALDADTTYTHAIAAREKLVLSRRNALDADSLLHMVERRRDAGDAADMDVELARVNAGQQANAAAADSLTWISALLDLQAVLGIASDALKVNATDSLATPPVPATTGQVTLNESAASLSLESAQLSERLQRRSVWSQFSITGGIETGGDPEAEPGILPTFGIGIGLPLFDRNRGPIAQAQAERIRAQAELTLAQVEARNQIAHAIRERSNALARVERDRQLVTSAERVAQMSITAYREGAQSLPNVLQAQRSARDVISQYIDDLAAAWIATAELRIFSLTSTTPLP